MNKGFWDKLPKPFFCLAPMADVTDAAFRWIITKYSKYDGQDIGVYGKFIHHLRASGGPNILWTEFVSADGLFRGGYDHLIHDLEFTEAERPIVAQFFSKEPELMARAARLAESLGFDGVDINMGCPDRNVCKQGAGAAMIQTPKLAQEIIRITQEATKLPVSVKTRIGYSRPEELEQWLPTILQTNPVAVALHARTKKEMSKVPAHWDATTRAVKIRDDLGSNALIIGNGDVEDVEDARKKAEETGADGIMLGRAIFGNPWLFSGVARPHLNERLQVLREHILLFDELLGEVKNFAVMKKHFKSYISGEDGDKQLVIKMMETSTAREAVAVVDAYLT